MGRTFYSPKSSGIYFSVILRPTLNIEDSLLITTSVAVAVAEAIEQVTAVKAEIKWVNDIFANGKKVCGILTEASLNFEGGGLEYAVVGIGININTNDFPEDMKEVAGSVLSEQSSNALISSRLIAEVLNNIAKSMNSLTSKKYVDEYRKRSFLLGKDIFVLKGKETLPAKAIDIDDKARLIVEYENHLKETLSSGEVSIRIKK
jgi:BirA family biotin operon repressor/biotin-[acetyl-CoA-carboxylase] ligase